MTAAVVAAAAELRAAAAAGNEDQLAKALVSIREVKSKNAAATAAQVASLKRLSGKYQDAGVDQADTEGLSALHLAACNGHSSCVSLLLAEGASVDRLSGKTSSTALCIAASKGHTQCVQVLLQSGAQVNCADNTASAQTALHKAAQNGHAAVVKMLLDAGADTTIRDNEGNTALDYASTSTFLTVKRECADLIMGTPSGGIEALHKAAQSGDDREIVRLVRELKVDMNASMDGYPPLYWAALRGHHKAVAALVDEGALVDKQGKNGCPPLWAAVLAGNETCIDILITRGAPVDQRNKLGQTPLYCAVLYDMKIHIIKRLLESKADTTLSDNSGRSVFVLAIHKHKREHVEAMIKYQPINHADEAGRTPLHHAVLQGDGPIVKLLLAADADIKLTDKAGKTALDLANENNQDESAQRIQAASSFFGRLLRPRSSNLAYAQVPQPSRPPPPPPSSSSSASGAYKPFATDKENKIAGITRLQQIGVDTAAAQDTKLMWLLLAADAGNTRNVKVLIHEMQSNVNKATDNGITALLVAATAGFVDTVDFLLKNGAAPDKANSQGETPLHRAAENGHSVVIRLLLNAGSNPALKNARGQTAQDRAEQCDHRYCAQLLSDAVARS